ncbi:MAG: DUF4297 domain-containing protein [Proteobacteria bacterium]|nr:DUF4297 domain-containing protein [Pseudomonadota bacterium]
MNTSTNKNPLLSPQRETAGATTFGKYEYQYHWALFRALQEYADGNEFVVFVELHEDVVVGDSLDCSKVRFEFNQIKNITGRPWTVNKITKRDKKNGKENNSVVGKMLQGVDGKKFKDKIDKLNLVATCGFNLKLKDELLKFDVIGFGDLHDDCVKEIEDAISKELIGVNVPVIINFVTPKLPAEGFDHRVVSEISAIVESKNYNGFSNVRNIYRILMDDLRKKGVVVYDYNDWNDVLKNKGLTSTDVNKITMSNIRTANNIEGVSSLFDDVMNELNVHLGEKSKLKRAFTSYENKACFDKTVIQLEISNELKKVVASNIEIFEKYGVPKFIDAIFENADHSLIGRFPDDTEFKGAVIYELIMSIL